MSYIFKLPRMSAINFGLEMRMCREKSVSVIHVTILVAYIRMLADVNNMGVFALKAMSEIDHYTITIML